ncbi:LysR family transcriptional regulator [Achromobacter sp. GG226]|uniref:LysR family transcriptional regulator n=1 Tax=Verticiella alkaliphila TaxID=2779529 RepID=UPI001C0D2E4E|nr:LysR family transcriptional regulator [Verticiella sp. GG226]MBU4610467.1 LysR family transcriptional regulator [Verticiella sp. GG226]
MLNQALRYFLEVANTGSLSAASVNLHVAISAISRQIARLEEDVGAPLFERAARGMTLTEAGRMLLAHARRTALETQSVLTAIGNLAGIPGNLIRVSCSQGLANDLVPTEVARFRDRHPDTRFALWVGKSSVATQLVAEGEADVAVTFSVDPTPGIQVRHSVQSPVHAVMAADHPLAARPSLSMDDIQRYPLALTDKGTMTRNMYDHSRGMAGVYVEAAVTSNYSGTLHALVRESHSILLAGYVSMAGRLARNNLVARPLIDPEMQFRSVQIQVMAGRQLPVLIESFIERLAHALDALREAELKLGMDTP